MSINLNTWKYSIGLSRKTTTFALYRQFRVYPTLPAFRQNSRANLYAHSGIFRSPQEHSFLVHLRDSIPGFWLRLQVDCYAEREAAVRESRFGCLVHFAIWVGFSPLLTVIEKVLAMIPAKQYRCINSASCRCTKGHLNEDVIFLVFQHMNWNPKAIAAVSHVCKLFDDLAKRVLWKEFCRVRAPKMMVDLQSNGSHSIDGNWRALAKLLIYCSGSSRGGLFGNLELPGHFVYRTRFSRTAGRSFLMPPCKNDVLYVSDPCEHLDQSDEGDVGFFRGVFKSFSMSIAKRMFIRRGAELHSKELCPYCKAKMWDMRQAKMIPQSAFCRLGAYEDSVDCYVCLNGHVLGCCILLPLSDSEEASELE